MEATSNGRESAPAPTPEPKKPEPERLTIREVMKEVTALLGALVGEHLAAVSDDAYNIAILANPWALAVAYGREARVTVADGNMQKVYANNELRVPVMVVVTADNDAHDVEVLLAAGSEGAPQAGALGPGYAALVRPGQELWIGVRAVSYVGARLYLTIVPLRGRASVFGAF